MSDVQSVAPTTTPITLAEVKQHLNVSTTADDSYLTDLISSAVQYCEDRTNRAFINQTRVLKMQTFGDSRYVHDRVIFPPRSPLSSVTSISYVATDGTTTTLGTSAYLVSTGDQPGRIAESYNHTWPATRNTINDVTVTYICGHGSTQGNQPAHVKHAIRMAVGHWYRNREAVLVGEVSSEVSLGLDALLGKEHVETYG